MEIDFLIFKYRICICRGNLLKIERLPLFLQKRRTMVLHLETLTAKINLAFLLLY